MCNLAYDYVITTFNCHYHELLHLLINYKLNNLPLYTHPFLQEGFAVAFGSRGGKEPEVILSFGYFIAGSGFLNYKDLLNADNYKSYDVSMSYPLSGLYNKFLITRLGIEKYLDLYFKYSSTNINNITISLKDIPSQAGWLKYLDEYPDDEQIKIYFDEKNYKTLIDSSYCTLKEKDDYYFLKTNGSILISTANKKDDFTSKAFRELYPKNHYKGEKYLIRVNDSEIAVYNLFTNNLIADYVSGFTVDMKPVPKENGFYKFLLNKNLFDERIDKLTILKLEKQ